ncbi:hypothetical protein HNQ79_005676 [Streptomyces candidus]|uniref:Uncharacterized protein n=1 Tax=Streptomyces candidus TaxID=67283 RepID=A0A7X0HK64_9ACTN|nr:hypothetical protein [Streptomyces candidus]GHH55124.1 hypothetical protein GCM10018773_59080 [Streptomyces candidus]
MTTYGRHGGRAVLALSSVALAACLAGAAAHASIPGGTPTSAAPPAASHSPRPVPFGAFCRTSIERSESVAYCHNPYPETDLVQLHTECRRWWDIDGDSAPVAVGPAETVRLSGRCWKEVSSTWVTHARAPEPADPPHAPGHVQEPGRHFEPQLTGELLPRHLTGG